MSYVFSGDDKNTDFKSVWLGLNEMIHMKCLGLNEVMHVKCLVRLK